MNAVDTNVFVYAATVDDVGADVLYTEDLQAGERIDGVRIVDPFSKQPPIPEP